MTQVMEAAPDLGFLYDTYGRVVYSLALRIVKDEELAQDIAQEVFLAVWSDPFRYDAIRGSFSSWLLAMTHHKAVDTVRREEARHRHAQGMHGVTAGDDRPGNEHDIHEQVWSQLRSEHVRHALRELSQPQRQALFLAYFEGYSQREIAVLTGSPLGTVKTRMHHGMRRLHALLEEAA